MKEKNNKSILFITQAAVIAALYAALTMAQDFLIPGSTSMAVQFRASEALTLLACYTPAAIPGLTLGCFLANIMNAGTLPVDMIMGAAASLLAALAMWFTRKITVKGIPLLAAVMPALFNGVIIGLEIEIFFIEGEFNFVSFLTQGALVALGELVVCCTLGILLCVAINKTNLKKILV